MKRLPMLIALTASFAAVSAMAADPQNGMSMPGMQMAGAASAQKEKLGRTTGKVLQVDAAHSRLTITHHPVPAFGWPAMTMGFQATVDQLKGLSVGDLVDFEFYMHGSTAVIARIHKIG